MGTAHAPRTAAPAPPRGCVPPSPRPGVSRVHPSEIRRLPLDCRCHSGVNRYVRRARSLTCRVRDHPVERFQAAPLPVRYALCIHCAFLRGGDVLGEGSLARSRSKQPRAPPPCTRAHLLETAGRNGRFAPGFPAGLALRSRGPKGSAPIVVRVRSLCAT